MVALNQEFVSVICKGTEEFNKGSSFVSHVLFISKMQIWPTFETERFGETWSLLIGDLSV